MGVGGRAGQAPLLQLLPLPSFLRSAPTLPVAALEGARLGLFPLSGTAINLVADATAFPTRSTSFRAQKEASAGPCPGLGLPTERRADPGPRAWEGEGARGGLACPGMEGMEEVAAKPAGGGPQ